MSSPATDADALHIFHEIAGNLREVFWLRDLQEERIVYVSPAFETIWGRSVKELLASPRLWIDSIHPDDRERVLSAAINEARSVEDLMVYRIVRPDGKIRTVRDRSYPVKNAQGKFYRLAGLVEDITDRKP